MEPTLRFVLGLSVLMYVIYCWTHQKFWSRRHFDWKPKEYWPEAFWLIIIIGLSSALTLLAPFLF
ncbi:MAG: hypothetical protein CL896_03630 [Dehalococcoidia bacterium]|nr:hypothetical protein [Dehalococcoidia bacterium]